MKGIRGLTISLWVGTIFAFILPWVIFLPVLLRWSIASSVYLIGAIIWAIAMFMYAKMRPLTEERSWLIVRRNLRNLMIVHLALIPCFWISMGLYTGMWFSAKMNVWNEEVNTRISQIQFPDKPEAEMMKQQVHTVLVLRTAAMDPDLNDLRWLLDHKLHVIDVHKTVDQVDKMIANVNHSNENVEK